MIKKYIYLILVSLVSIACVQPSWGAEVDKIISSWEKQYSDIDSYTASFTQEVFSEKETKVETSGIIFFKKPNYFRWEVEKPDRQIIIGDGKVIWVYIPAFKQVMQKSYEPEEGFGPFWFTSLEPILKIKRNFQITRPLAVKTGNDSLEVLEFTPKSAGTGVSRVQAWLNKNNFLPLRVEIFFSDGILTRFVYSDIKKNIDLTDDLFIIKFPDKVEIYKEE